MTMSTAARKRKLKEAAANQRRDLFRASPTLSRRVTWAAATAQYKIQRAREHGNAYVGFTEYEFDPLLSASGSDIVSAARCLYLFLDHAEKIVQRAVAYSVERSLT
jgi:hypothetical protein